MSIQEFFQNMGIQHVSGSDSSFYLGATDSIWYLEQGSVELFSVERNQEGTRGRRFHICTIESGQLIFGRDSDSAPYALDCLVTLQLESVLYRVQREDFLKFHDTSEAGGECSILVNNWVNTLSSALIRDKHQTSRKFLRPNADITIDAGQYAGGEHELLWCQLLEGKAIFLDIQPLEKSGQLIPLPPDAWLLTSSSCLLRGVRTEDILSTPFFFKALDNFLALILHCYLLERANTLEFEAARVTRKRERDTHAMRESLDDFVSILHPEAAAFREEDPQDLLFSVCLRIGRSQDITFFSPPVLSEEMDQLSEICKSSKVRKRTIHFERDWQSQEHGPILGFLSEEQRPVALLPATSKSYNVFDPVTRKTMPVTDDLIKKLLPDGIVFYRPFATNILNIFNILKFAAKGSKLDIFTIVGMSILAAFLGLIPPLVSAQIFDTVIPDADRGMLFQYGIALFAAAIGTTAFQLTRSFAMLRAETRMDSALQFAVMDRLLSLPPTFFRKYTVGDLASRVNAITTIRQHLTGVALSSVLSGFFSVFYLTVLFFYSFKLALVAIAATIPPFLVTLLSGAFDIKYNRKLLNISGRISGVVLQFLTGLSKLRVAGAEHRAFAVWARSFAKEKRAAYTVRMISNIFATFHGVYPIMAIGLIYFFASFYLEKSLSTGSFIAFITAYGSFMSAILGLGGTIVSVMRVIPLYERAQPILASQPEIHHDHVHPGVLDGTIEINNLSFRYDENSPQVLQNFNMKVNPGESVAIVGPSGSGKSTLLRLLLRFEKPENGTIFYSNQNLQNLDIQSVRQQIGTVLQGGRVIAGDIFVNIVGSSALSIDDAWKAAKQAGFEQDIRNMPMGMHTYVSEGGTNLSGGQRQRLLIARSFAMAPRIMFFDEATSALDNETQRIVSRSMDEMHITRVVIAHRLSTIKNADTIYVLDKGKVEQKGTYGTLIQQQGLFATLAKRQLV